MCKFVIHLKNNAMVLHVKTRSRLPMESGGKLWW